MIERIVLLKLKDEQATPELIAEVASYSREVLRRLPGVLECHVGVAAEDRTSSSWHLALVLRFASVEDLEPYAMHPDHRAYVDEYLQPRLESITAYNFEV
jgi:hypothetical protein